jgi:hypothetical protein
MNVWFIAAFVLFYWIYYERIIYTEEQFLERKFGSVYQQWAAVTPCFIPDFRKWRKAEVPFSWKKVVKKEKNGLLALLLIFSFFDIAGRLIVGEPPRYIPLAIAAGVMVVIYLILKLIKHKTKLLDEAGR